MEDTVIQNTNNIDILGREDIIEELKKVILILSDNHKSCTFALDGKWGCGKTFVLNLLEKEVADYQSPETAFDKFLVFHYDCWKYDYYDEPLIAIIAAMLDIVEEQKSLFTSETAKRIKDGWRIATKTVTNVAKEISKNTIGFSLSECANEAKKETENKKDTKYKFDGFFAFNKTIQYVRNEIAELAKNRTILIVVDELDRCLPEYTIKVLERLHHVFEGIDNTIVLLSMDKNQIKNIVNQIFGTEYTDAYLRKFINFEISLDIGEVSSKFKEKYVNYISLFDENAQPCQKNVEEIISCIFDGIDARTQDKIVKKAELLHSMVFSTKPDYAVMCVELLWLVIKYWNNEHSINSDFPGDLTKPFKNLRIGRRTNEFFSDGFCQTIHASKDGFPSNMHYFAYSNTGVLELIIVYWSHIYLSKKNIYITLSSNNAEISKNISLLQEFANLNELIK